MLFYGQGLLQKLKNNTFSFKHLTHLNLMKLYKLGIKLKLRSQEKIIKQKISVNKAF